MSDVLCSMRTLQWANKQTQVAMTSETSKPTAVSGGTHFDSTIVYNSSNETATSYSQCARSIATDAVQLPG